MTLLTRVGVIVVAAIYITMLLTFFAAYMRPDKRILVTLDEYHEADLEALLLLVTSPAAIKFLYSAFKGGFA